MIEKRKNMEFAIYSRKSKQTGKGESIQNQIEYCRKYIASRFGENHKIHIFAEEGYSAKNRCRPQFQSMLTIAEQKKLDYIICYRLDRISRNVGDFALLIEQLTKWETAFICVQEQFDTSTPTGRAMMYMASVFAQLERETIGERVKDNMFYLAKKGYWLGGTFPLGFTSIRVSENGHSYCHLVQQEKEIKIVQKIYFLFLEYYNLSAVKRKLEEEKIYSRQGNAFSLMALKEILTNPVYCKADQKAREYFYKKGAEVTFSAKQCSNNYGLMVYNKRNYSKKAAPRQKIEHWIVALGKQKGILSGEVWVSIQNYFERSKKKQKTENNYALLSGILYCGSCGEKMQPKKRKNHTFDYICKSKLQGKNCVMQNLAGKETDSQTESYLLDYIESLAKQQNKKIGHCSFGELWKGMEIKQKQEAIRFLIKKGVWNGTELQYFL